jgi:hypothetical protein
MEPYDNLMEMSGLVLAVNEELQDLMSRAYKTIMGGQGGLEMLVGEATVLLVECKSAVRDNYNSLEASR